MRELIVVFYGNEISLGVMLANWLLWTALGSSVLGRVALKVRDPRKLMAGLQALLAVAFPLTILAVRASKSAFQTIPGELLGPGPMFLTSFAALSVFCVISGSLFAAGSRLYAQEVGTLTGRATGAVYLLEALGSGVGGILASLVLIRFLAAFEIASVLCLLNLLAAISLGIRVVSGRRVMVATLAGMALLLPFANRALESKSLAILWRGFHLVETRNSVYGNLAVVETGQSRSLFENGLNILTVPDPAAAEEAVHFGLLEHPSPKRLLLIGGGVNGSLLQALQHPSLKWIDYVELDPTILDLAARHFPQAWGLIRADPRVHIHPMDGRLFLKTTALAFDVIIVNLPDPHTAQLNRFYTEEFFREAAEKLAPGGILSFQVRAAEDYISQELADFLRCLLKTLRAVFPEVTAIPGETVHFFAAAQRGTLTTDPSELLARLRLRHLRTRYVREYYIPFRMSPDRMLDLQLQIEPRPETPVNRDFAPIAYYFDVALWSSQFHSRARQWFEVLARVKFGSMAGTLALVLFVLAGLIRWGPWRVGARHPAAQSGRAAGPPEPERPAPETLLPPGHRRTGYGVPLRGVAGFCVAAMGFSLLGLEMLILLGFQALYGYVYHQLAILVALFMVGMAVGAWLGLPAAGQAVAATQPEMRKLASLQVLAAVSPLLLYELFALLGQVRSSSGLFAVSQVLFPALALVSGLLGGYQFPLASRIYFADSSARSPGALYGLDLLGACLGAFALSAFLVPVYGFFRTALLIAVVDFAPALLAALAVSPGLTASPD
jgi:spermidine synthase